MNENDHYSTLGCSKESTYEEIKRAYHALILKHHPDKNQSKPDDAFEKISKAWQILSEPNSRAEYDAVHEQRELESNFLIYETITPNDLIKTDDAWKYLCKCGSHYHVSQDNLSRNETIIYIPCESCSFVIAITFNQ